MTRTDLLDLAERVEAGSGEDPVLAAEVFQVIRKIVNESRDLIRLQAGDDHRARLAALLRAYAETVGG